MTRARVLQGVRPRRFEERYARRQQRTLTRAEAVEMLGVTERTFRRLGRPSGRAVPLEEALRMVTRYTGWTVKHFHEQWHTAHGGHGAYSWTKKTLQAAGQVPRATRRGAHRKKRPRKPLPGMMLPQAGSTHEWVPAVGGGFDRDAR